MKLKLQTKYSIGILLLLFFVISLLTLTFAFKFKFTMQEVTRSSSLAMQESLISQIENRANTLVHYLSEALVNPLYEYNVGDIYDMIKSAREEEDVIYVYVYDTENSIIQDGTFKLELSPEVKNDPICKTALRTGDTTTKISGDYLDIAYPISIGDDILGGVRARFSLSGINKNIDEMKHSLVNIGAEVYGESIKQLVIISGILTVLAVFFSIIIAKGFTKPISALASHAILVGTGDYSGYTGIKRNDEIGELAESFGLMVENLKKTTVSRDYVDSIIENMAESLIVIDQNSNIKTINKTALVLSGYKSEELIGKTIDIIFRPENKLEFSFDNIQNLIYKGPFTNVKGVMRTRNQQEIPVTLSGRLIYKSSKNLDPSSEAIAGVVCVVHDMRQLQKFVEKEKELAAATAFAEAERKKLEEIKRLYEALEESHEELKATQDQLVQAEKLRVVGTLASGVAHEVKNPLAIIMLGVDYLSRYGNIFSEDTMPMLKSIESAIGRANFIIQGLLDFSSLSQLSILPFDLNLIIENSILLMKHEFDKNRINFVKSLKHGLPFVEIDKNRIEQVFINLFMNSVQAMHDGGEIAVRTYTKTFSKEDAKKIRAAENTFDLGEEIVVAEVTDNGPGIPDEMVSRVFDPFFTTKHAKKGTGLGLAIVRNIIEMHKGSIWIQNRDVGYGIIVTLMFKPFKDE
ncbi:MAG: ATP-binding protein [Candidatus Omnitrophota bacterium]